MIELFGRAGLDDAPVEHDRHAVGDRERLLLVVCHQHGGGARLAQNLPHLLAHRGAQIGVEIGERLVEQDHLRPRRQGARQRHALLLPAGELIGGAPAQPGQPDRRQRGVDARIAVRAMPGQAEGHVLRHAEMRKQRVVLKDHPHPAPLGRHPAAAARARGAHDVAARSRSSRRRGRSKPAMRRSAVVLPQPLGPSKARNSPRCGVQIETAQHLDVAVVLLEPAHAECWREFAVRRCRQASWRGYAAASRAPRPIMARAPARGRAARGRASARRRRRSAARLAPRPGHRPRRWRRVQTSTASVFQPVGLSSSVAGSSFIAVSSTSAAPARMPGRASGAVTLATAPSWLRPNPRAASSRWGLTCNSAARLAAERLGQEAHHARRDQHRQRLIHAACRRQTRRRPTPRPAPAAAYPR